MLLNQLCKKLWCRRSNRWWYARLNGMPGGMPDMSGMPGGMPDMSGMPGGMPGGMPDMSQMPDMKPTVEEVD